MIKKRGRPKKNKTKEIDINVINTNGEIIPFYEVILDTVGIKYKAEGLSVDEAIANLGLSWEQIKAKGVMTIKQGDKSYEHLFYLKQLKRIFANKLTRILWSKRLKLFLGSK